MPIDVSIQINGHNSYRVTETVFCHPFGVQGMAYITHSFNAYAASALGAATRARTRFFKADGSIAGTTDHSFAVGVIFAEVDITVAVPATAVLCQFSFLASDTWWVAEPKSEEGQTATPYNTNYAGQLSMITPDGAYLGFLRTNQIVVAGTLADPTELLEDRLVTINNNAITLAATHGARMTSIEAAQIILASDIDTVTPRVTRLTSGGVYTGEVVAGQMTTGKLQSVSGEVYFDLDNNVLACNKMVGSGTNKPYIKIDDAPDGSSATKALALYSYADYEAAYVQAFAAYFFGGVGTKLQGRYSENYMYFGHPSEGAEIGAYNSDKSAGSKFYVGPNGITLADKDDIFKFHQDYSGAYTRRNNGPFFYLPEVCTGAGTSSSTSGGDTTVTFQNEFSGIPVVCANSTGSNSYTCRIKSVSADGFVLVMNAASAGFNYIAIYEKL